MSREKNATHTYTIIIERCLETGLYIGSVPSFPGAYSQGNTIDELDLHMKEVITMLLEDGELDMRTQYVGTKTVVVETDNLEVAA